MRVAYKFTYSKIRQVEQGIKQDLYIFIDFWQREENMLKIEQGSLSMENYDLDHIEDNINSGDSPIEALSEELKMCGLNIDDVYSIDLNGEQLSNKRYRELYSKILNDLMIRNSNKKRCNK